MTDNHTGPGRRQIYLDQRSRLRLWIPHVFTTGINHCHQHLFSRLGMCHYYCQQQQRRRRIQRWLPPPLPPRCRSELRRLGWWVWRQERCREPSLRLFGELAVDCCHWNCGCVGLRCCYGLVDDSTYNASHGVTFMMLFFSLFILCQGPSPEYIAFEL